VLRFAQDLGRSEVASRIGCHPANVTKVLRRILIRLRAAAAPRSPL
jgi:DNA-directed RNA polymerase specialized sigma subunit